jgi:3-methylfumaryl-CoA hydratase
MGTYDQWIGREELCTDSITAAPAHLLAASLDRGQVDFAVGDELPPVWHWLYFLRAGRTSEVGRDGHPPRGGFLPAIPLPRRMRAGGKFEFRRPLHVGDVAERRSRIISVEEKTGASGPLAFVVVQHEIAVAGEVAVIEQESIVYRDAPTATQPTVAAASSAAATFPPEARRYPTNEVLLFRISALTFNSHRIHYDRPYAMIEEAYPGLVVHGPLVALFMLEYLQSKRPATGLRKFSYRALAPVFCGEDVAINEAFDAATGSTRVVARGVRGVDAVVGDAIYAPPV